ncbi:MAG: mRNA-degrading endonuclease RelE of RelBE toxin-antitoxin system [Patescibacteria group bacterium]|jgi:mRNA-degrading endonuclease RelE of RelBE toxin-antitoxin system
MPQWIVNWVEGIDKDFRSFEEFAKVKEKIETIAHNPVTRLQKVKGYEPIKKLRLGDHRLFVYLNYTTQEIHCITYLPRKKCYNKDTLEHVQKKAQKVQ